MNDPSSQLMAYIPSPSRGYFHIGSLTIHFYALCIIIGVIAGSVLAAYRWEKRGGLRTDVYDALIIAIPLGIIGARLYHVITDWRLYFGPDAPHRPVDAL